MIMRQKIKMYILAVAFVGLPSLQAQILTPEDDGLIPKNKLHHKNNEYISYAFLRQDDMMWSTRHWEEIFISEKINQSLFYPIEPLPDRVSLFTVLKDAIMVEGSITEVYSDAYFKQPLTPQEVAERLTNVKIEYDDFGKEVINDTTDLVPENVISWRIKSDWYFDKQRGTMENRIIGICPYVKQPWEDDPVELFWIWFPDARSTLVHNIVYNPNNRTHPLNFDQLFQMRLFNAKVYKEDNVYDRNIADYIKFDAREQNLESSRIRESLRDYEHSLWEY